MKIDGTARPGNSLVFLPPAGEGVRIATGDLVRADVLALRADGTVSVRITTEGGKSAVVSARSDVPLDAGECILLKVAKAGSEVSLRFLGVVGEENAAGLPLAFRGLAGQLAAARLPSEGARQALESLRVLAQAVKESVPALPSPGESPGMEALDGAALKRSVEESGILLETKLKASGAKAGLPGTGFDRKDALLRLGEALRDRGVAAAVKASGGSPGEAAARTDGLLSTIESYQLSSAAHGVLYAPLTLDWDELADGEMLFRKRAREKGESYTCVIRLDLRPLGRMSVSVTMYDGSFFVSLSPESETTRSLLASRADDFGKRFREAGLALAAVNIHRKNRVAFGVPECDGVDLEA